MKATITKITYADYRRYRESFIKDGMTPLSYIDWIRVQRTSSEDWANGEGR